jgi:hypothetical protein
VLEVVPARLVEHLRVAAVAVQEVTVTQVAVV